MRSDLGRLPTRLVVLLAACLAGCGPSVTIEPLDLERLRRAMPEEVIAVTHKGERRGVLAKSFPEVSAEYELGSDIDLEAPGAGRRSAGMALMMSAGGFQMMWLVHAFGPRLLDQDDVGLVLGSFSATLLATGIALLVLGLQDREGVFVDPPASDP